MDQSNRQSGDNNFITGFGFALLAVVLWSGNFIAAKALNKSISPVSLAFFRWLTATVILFPVAFKKFREEWRIILPHIKYISLTALMGVTLFNTLVYVAGRYTTATNLALIGTTASPVFVLLISGLILKQKVSLNQVLGAAICITGILVLISNGNFNNLRHLHFSQGDGWVILAALSFAIYTVLVRRKPKEISSIPFLFSIFLVGTIFLLPAYLWDAATGNGFEWDRTIFLSVLYLGIGASVISFLAWNRSIQCIGATRAALFGNLIPVFSTIEASIILHEEFKSITAVSFAIILIGLLVANLNFSRSRK